MIRSKCKYTYLSFFIIIIFIILFLYLHHFSYVYESFYNNENKQNENKQNNKDNKNKIYLFPTKGLQQICEEKGLIPAYGPTGCFINGEYDPYANCKCRDKETGECKICYDNIKEDERTSTVVYNALVKEANTGNQ
jgi:hypothetical protein